MMRLNRIYKLFFFGIISILFLSGMAPNPNGGSAGSTIISTIIALVVLVLVFLILREFMCWYWKVNLMLSKFDNMVKLLETLVRQNEKGYQQK